MMEEQLRMQQEEQLRMQQQQQEEQMRLQQQQEEQLRMQQQQDEQMRLQQQEEQLRMQQQQEEQLRMQQQQEEQMRLQQQQEEQLRLQQQQQEEQLRIQQQQQEEQLRMQQQQQEEQMRLQQEEQLRQQQEEQMRLQQEEQLRQQQEEQMRLQQQEQLRQQQEEQMRLQQEEQLRQQQEEQMRLQQHQEEQMRLQQQQEEQTRLQQQQEEQMRLQQQQQEEQMRLQQQQEEQMRLQQQQQEQMRMQQQEQEHQMMLQQEEQARMQQQQIMQQQQSFQQQSMQQQSFQQQHTFQQQQTFQQQSMQQQSFQQSMSSSKSSEQNITMQVKSGGFLHDENGHPIQEDFTAGLKPTNTGAMIRQQGDANFPHDQKSSISPSAGSLRQTPAGNRLREFGEMNMTPQPNMDYDAFDATRHSVKSLVEHFKTKASQDIPDGFLRRQQQDPNAPPLSYLHIQKRSSSQTRQQHTQSYIETQSNSSAANNINRRSMSDALAMEHMQQQQGMSNGLQDPSAILGGNEASTLSCQRPENVSRDRTTHIPTDSIIAQQPNLMPPGNCQAPSDVALSDRFADMLAELNSPLPPLPPLPEGIMKPKAVSNGISNDHGHGAKNHVVAQDLSGGVREASEHGTEAGWSKQISVSLCMS